MPKSPPKKRARAATLADVGRAAGVSAMAASTVLNGARTSSRIAHDTRQRILDAASHLNYRANATARALAARRMNTIGVATVYDDGAELNFYFLEVLKGVLDGASHYEQNTTVFTLHHWSKDIGRLARFCDGRIDGMILVAPIFSREEMQTLPEHTPFVTVHANAPVPGATNLESDEESGMLELIKRLVGLGHRRIVHFAGPRNLLGTQRRIRGYERALIAGKLEVDPSLIVETGFTTSSGYAATQKWLAEHASDSLPDAFSCANDGCAIGCLAALAENGIQVPHDISVTGFDDTLAARTTVPQLATIRQPLRTMGEHAVLRLLAAIDHQNEHTSADNESSIVFPTEIVLRGSVAEKGRKKASSLD